MLHEDPKKEEKTEGANVAGSREVDSSRKLQVGATAKGSLKREPTLLLQELEQCLRQGSMP